jgi:hypothetical protein
MDKHRKTAIIVGILYILGTVAGVLSVVVTRPVLSAPDYLSEIAAKEASMLVGSLLVLMMGLVLALVPVLLYPILKRYDEILALAYVVFRGALEMTCYIAMTIDWLFLILVSQEAAVAGADGLPALQSFGAIFMKGSDSIANVLVIIFSLDALMLYTMLYRSQLIPRWISVWGFIAILMHFSTAFLLMFDVINMNTATMINLPIFLQEMVMAVWLIVKGFNPAALASGTAKTA